MEIFRRLGVADAVRAAGSVTTFHRRDFTTAISGEELLGSFAKSHQRFGPDGRSAPGYPDSHWLTPEPVVRVSQYYLNPILHSYAREMANVTLRSETLMKSFEDTGDSVIVRAERRDGSPLTVRARYLIGCDGAVAACASKWVSICWVIRKSPGPEHVDSQPRRHAPLSRQTGVDVWILNPRITGVVVAIDGDELWLVHRNLANEMTSYEDLDFDQSIRDRPRSRAGFSLGDDSTPGLDRSSPRRRSVSSRQHFIAGDAAHLWIPYAGYGMKPVSRTRQPRVDDGGGLERTCR